MCCPHCAGPLAEVAEALACGSCSARYSRRDGLWDLTSGGVPRTGYDAHYFPGIAETERRHFWFRHRRETILAALRRRVSDLSSRSLFDIGCGTGGLLWFLSANGVPIRGACDSYVEGLRLARGRFDAPLFVVDEGRLPPLAPGQDLVSLFDVLEHLDDDVGTLREIVRHLQPDGVVIVTVPAHPFLFDEADRLAHHRRRYRRAELRAKLESAGLTVELVTHFMSVLVPGLVIARAAGRLLAPIAGSAKSRRDAELRVTPGLNGMLYAALALERRWLPAHGLPFGTSLLAIARRPACE